MTSNFVTIDLQGIEKFYSSGKTSTRILQKIDLKIKTGEYCAIMGASGSGKSTLGNIIGCLERPSAGKYYLNGIAVDRFNDNQLEFIRNHQIGFVFPQFHLLSEMNVLENVMLSIISTGIPPLKRFNQAEIALQKVGLESHSDKYPDQLSQEQQQRVAIARAIVNRPILLLADEPISTLDSYGSQEIMAVFDSLNRSGMTIVVVTQSYEVAQSCHRIIQIKDGKVEYLSDNCVLDKDNCG